MEEKKIFAGGGMNMDTEERLIKSNEYRYALNCRVTSSDEENEGAVENVVGNLELHKLKHPFAQDGDGNDIFLSDTRFKVIGFCEDEKLNIFHYFVCDKGQTGKVSVTGGDTDLHCIVSNYSWVSSGSTPGAWTVLYADSDLNFKPNALITGANVIHSNEFAEGGMLYWTDNINQPRKLNVRRAYWWTKTLVSGANPATFGFEFSYQEKPDLNAISLPPITPPFIGSFSYIDAGGITQPTTGNNLQLKSNDIKDSMWQFKYRYIYEDNQKSSWSPISTSGMTSFNDNSITDMTISNYLEVRIESGVQEVKSIEIAVRKEEVKGDFYRIKTINKDNTKQSEVLLSSTAGSLNNLNIGDVIDRDLANNSFLYFIFTGNEPMIPIHLQESNKLFDDVPLKAKAQEVIDGNRLAYGNVVNGYDPVNTDVDLEVVYQDIAVSYAGINIIPYTISKQFQDYYDSGSNPDYRWGIKCQIKFQVGDVASLPDGTAIILKIDDLGMGAMFRRWSSMGGVCPFVEGKRLMRINLETFPYTKAPGDDISDLLTHITANNHTIEWTQEQAQGNSGARPKQTNGWSTGSVGSASGGFTDSFGPGIDNSAWSVSGNNIVYKFYVTSKDAYKSACGNGGIQPHIAFGFDGKGLWSIDYENNANAPSPTNTGTPALKWADIASVSQPITHGGWTAYKSA